MKGSNGPRRRTRNLTKKQREKGKNKIRDYLQEFKVGADVSISINPSYQKMPHPRFQGRTGKVVGQQGRGCIVEIRDGSKKKKIITQPQHLKPMR